MRVRTYLAAGALGISAIVGVATIVAAQDLTPAPSPFGPSPQKPPLFDHGPSLEKAPLSDPRSLSREQQEQMARGLALARLDGERTRVVCGMTVIPVQPSVDPKSIRKAPDDNKYTMRFVPPPMCGSTSVDTVQPAPEPAR
jgi:hypothetical protein